MSRSDEMKRQRKERERIKAEVSKIKKNRSKENDIDDEILEEDAEVIEKLSKKEKKALDKENNPEKYKDSGKKKFCVVVIILLSLVILSGIGYIVYNHFFGPKYLISNQFTVPVEEFKIKTFDTKSKTRPFAVMIDNNENAWPQFNINEALVVYEMNVEGGLSRLMAIFKDKPKLEKIGPLRSARHYFLDYVKEYDAIYVHEGYSPRAISEINSRGIDSVVYTSGLFYRDESRYAPHNAITSGQRMIDAAKKRKFSLTTKTKTPLKYSPFRVKLEKPISAQTITTGFGSYASLKLEYNEKTKKYEKHEIGELIKDGVTNKPLAATNIILVHSDPVLLTGYGEGKGRVDIDTTESMTGYYVTRGEAVKIKTSKKNRDAQTKYMLMDGKELKVNDGNTFIFLIPKNQKINIKGSDKERNNDDLETKEETIKRILESRK